MADPEALHLAVRGLVYVALACFAAALFFGVLFGLMGPAFRKLASRLRRKHRELRHTQKALSGLKNDLSTGAAIIKNERAKVRRLEETCTRYEAELVRVDKVRKRAEAGCLRKHEELEQAEAKVAGLLELVHINNRGRK